MVATVEQYSCLMFICQNNQKWHIFQDMFKAASELGGLKLADNCYYQVWQIPYSWSVVILSDTEHNIYHNHIFVHRSLHKNVCTSCMIILQYIL